jgi:iron complex outermembrane receptor protein
LLKYQDTLITGEVPIDRLNTPYYPTKLRLRAGTSWNSHRLSLAVFANYANGYENNADPTDIQHVGAFLTFDGTAGYVLPSFGSLLSDTRIVLSVQNILDRQPPFVQNPQPAGSADAGFNYDPVNASLLGRYLSLQLRSRW